MSISAGSKKYESAHNDNNQSPRFMLFMPSAQQHDTDIIEILQETLSFVRNP